MIDSHCHINDDLYKNNAEQYIKESEENGVKNFLVVGSNIIDSLVGLNIAKKFNNCYAAVGIHPSDIVKLKQTDFDSIINLANDKKVVAIGEIGLDYYWEKDALLKEKQKEAFIKQIEIANNLNLPIVVHCRDAFEDCLKILKNNKVKRCGIIHCYSGSYEVAMELIKLGFILGFGGTVTFKNSVKVKEVISKIPNESFVLETDAPYLAPVPFRGQPNHSKYLSLIRDEIAKLRGSSPEEITRISSENFLRIINEKNN